MWKESCENLCARRGGDCAVAVAGGAESAAAFLAAVRRTSGAEEPRFACAAGEVTFFLCEKEGVASADAVLFLFPAGCTAEEVRAAAQSAGKAPFLVVLDGGTEESCARLAETGAAVISCDCAGADDLSPVLDELLLSFPAAGLEIDLPDWMCVLPAESAVISDVLGRVRAVAPALCCVRDFAKLPAAFGEDVYCESFEADPVTGRAHCRLAAREGLFHRVLSEECGADVSDDLHLMAYVGTLRDAKKFYERFRNAVAAADAVGYGIATPAEEEVSLAAPELFRRGSRCGVRLKADAPAYHVIKIDVHSEVTPVSGEGERGEQLAKGVLESYERDHAALWDKDLFGKTFREMVQEGLREKQGGVPEEVRAKLRRALTRIVNEGKGGVVCILL